MTKKAALLINLGSPDTAEVGDVRRYLREFLSDPRVLDAPAPIRSFVLNCLILPTRPKASAEAYRKIWTEEGSPLKAISERQKVLTQELTEEAQVELAMRYGSPSIASAVKRLADKGIEEVFVMPLYPQYAMSSYETVAAKAQEEIAKSAPRMRSTLLQPFYEDPGYIEALAQSAIPYLENEYDRLLFSFHGVPERHLRKSDPSHAHCLCRPDCCESPHPAHATCYRRQCKRAMELVCERLAVPEEKRLLSFQSRLGRDPWLRPYTDHVLESLGGQGVRRILVICPAFVSDCLETLEEIAMAGKETFLEAGGESFTLIPCMNTHRAWIEWLADKINSWAKG